MVHSSPVVDCNLEAAADCSLAAVGKLPRPRAEGKGLPQVARLGVAQYIRVAGCTWCQFLDIPKILHLVIFWMKRQNRC